MKLATAFVEVRPDTRAFKRDLQKQTTEDARDVGKMLGQALAGGAFLAGAKRATDAASQLEQAVGGTAAVFGDSAQAVDEWAKGAAESAGLSERAARELTSSLGGLLKGFGFTEDAAASMSTELATLGADLAATFGGKPEEAVQALGAALRGETDPLERFGIALNQTLVNQKAVDLGLAESTSKVDQNAKAQATLALITERSADAQGQFAREIDTAAGQAAVSAAKTENAAADLGQNLLPIYTKVAEVVGQVADIFGALPEPVQTGVIAIAGIAALTGPVKAAASAIGSLATIARVALTKGLDTAAVGAYNLAGGLGSAMAVAGPLALIAAGLAIHFTENAKNAKRAEEAVNGFKEAIREAGDATEGSAQQIRDLVEEDAGFAELLAETGTGVDEVAAALNGSQEDFDAFKQSMIEQADAGDLSRDALIQATLGLDALRSAAQKAAGEVKTEGEVIGVAGDANATAEPKIAGAAGALSEAAEAGDAAAEATDRFRKAVEEYVTGPLSFEDAIDDQTQALADLAAEGDERAQAVIDARKRLAEVKADPDATAQDRIDAERELQEAIDATSTSLLGNSDAALRNRDNLRELTAGVVEVIEKGREQGLGYEQLKALRDIEIQSMRDALTQMGYNREEVDRFIERIEAIPLSPVVTPEMDSGPASVTLAESLRSWQEKADKSPIQVTLEVLAWDAIRGLWAGGGGRTWPTRPPRNAAGSPQVSDGVFTVGEHGTETMIKRGDSLQVLAGSPSAMFNAVGEDQLLTLREQNELLRGILWAVRGSGSMHALQLELT